MAFDLNHLAVTAAPLLRAIHAGNWNTRTELAQAADRHRNHIARDLGALVKAGLAQERAPDDCGKPVVLTDEGLAQLAALDRAADPNAGGALTALYSQIQPHPLNPRKDFETADAEEALDELRVSIVKSGLLQPIVVRPQPQPGKWWIIAGERRWRAIGQAISDGDWADDQPIAITVRDVDDRDHLLLALNENLQRSNMSAIEEGVAFAAAVHDFGLSTEELAGRTGKSQRYVQQRIALLKLDPADQDRMRLPKDHPDFLSFKAARALTQTPREAAPSFSQQMAAEHAPLADEMAADAPAPAADEPGSPEEDPATTFGRSLNDREALAFVELADKAERTPAADPALASEGYTLVADARDALRDAMVQRGLVAIRYRGGERPHARAYLMTSGAKAWLEQVGFYDPARRPALLKEFRTRVFGIETAINCEQTGAYATAWLNDTSRDEAAGRTEVYRRPQNVDPEIPARPMAEPEQPALIEETEEEKAARRRAERAAAEAAFDDRAVADFAEAMRQKMAAKRAQGMTGWAGASVADLADLLVGHVAKGDPVDIAIFAMMVAHRAKAVGFRGVPDVLRTMPTSRMEQLMIAARAARPASDEEPGEPDPVEDFVQAEIEDEEADAGGVWTEAKTANAGPGEPAVPIRKSITPDFIVCLEDGRKFKSLKRHLRTRYNLSPEEYIAKWGLPRDYPMVAPNYAKARADLARQMGLSEPA